MDSFEVDGIFYEPEVYRRSYSCRLFSVVEDTPNDGATYRPLPFKLGDICEECWVVFGFIRPKMRCKGNCHLTERTPIKWKRGSSPY